MAYSFFNKDHIFEILRTKLIVSSNSTKHIVVVIGVFNFKGQLFK